MEAREVQLNPLFAEIVQTLLTIVDGAEMYPRGHYKRMAALCVKLAEKIGLPPIEAAAVNLAALLHDIGMVYVPTDIIHKNGELTEDEMLVVRQHPGMSVKILANLSPLQSILPLIRHHHEAFDGSGYPDGLAGDRIPMGARIIHVVESFLVMAVPRPYRPPKSVTVVLNELEKNKGIFFDGRLVDEFVRLMGQKMDAPAQTTAAQSHGPAAPPPKPAEEGLKPEEIAKEIFEQVKRGKIELPVLPNIIQEIQTAIDNPNTTSDDLARIVEKDAIISIRLMSTANSPIYMGQYKVRSIREAIPRIGFKETRNIVSVIVSKNMFQAKSKEYVKWMEILWAHSLASAYGARLLADHLRYMDPEKYFLMGLVHDIGKVLIIKSISENPLWQNRLERSQVEKVMQIAHNSLGGVILRHWKFPKEFFEVATSHEGPKFFETTGRAILVVHLASQMASALGNGYLKETVDLAELDSAKRLKLDAATLTALSERIKTIMADSAKSF